MSGRDQRWLLIAATSRGAAEGYATRHGLDAPLILGRRDLLAPPWRLRRRIAAARVNGAAIHSLDWARERAPQLAELALGAAPVADRLLIDEATGSVTARDGALAPATAARLPFELAGAGISLAAVTLSLRRSPERRERSASPATPARMIAIWPLASGDVGGAVTHMSGILAALRRSGVRVALASLGAVPQQLRLAVDEVEVADPLPRGQRVSAEAEHLAANRVLARAAERLAARFEPQFVYQRHASLLGVGPLVSAKLGVPLVLEWNSSEAWKRRHWDKPPLGLRLLDRLTESIERRAIAGATVVLAVSARAGEMALDAGAAPQQVQVVPNGVDIAAVDAALARARHRDERDGFLVGWIGSFGPWHGAEVLVRSLPFLPPDIRLRMIGDGRERPEAEALARQLGVDDRIEWAGTMPHANALASLAGCDALASPHVPTGDAPFFGSPTKLFEYMALGRPIVASRLEQIGEVLEHEQTALLVEPGDERQLAAAVAALSQRPDRGASLGEAAAREARELHTWDRRAADLLASLRPS